MQPSDPRALDHALRVLLEENLGGARPPDLCDRILGAAAQPRCDAPPARPAALDEERVVDLSLCGEPTMDANDLTFLQAADSGAPRGLVRELCSFMSDNAKWWLTPFLIVFGLLGGLLILGATGAAPFIYTLF